MLRARVVRVSGGLWVECPAIVPGEVFGPCQRVGAMPAVGDWVLVADVGDPACPELVVVGVTVTAADPAPDLPVGAITAFAGTSAPAGWHLCDGSAHGSSALQAVLGSANAPDLRDRFVVGAGSTYSRGATGGAATVTLDVTEMPAHTHTQTYYSSSLAASGSALGGMTGGGGASSTSGQVTLSTGGGGAHENRPPYYALVYIVKL